MSTGRPTVITAKVVRLLITSFHNGLTVRQACWQSGISHEAYYQRLKNDPEFTDKMMRSQQLATITAKTNIVSAIKNGDLSASKWWLERKASKEFSRTEESADDPQEAKEAKSYSYDEASTILADTAELDQLDAEIRRFAEQRNLGLRK